MLHVSCFMTSMPLPTFLPAKKSFSQNFLRDQTVIKRIIEAAEIQPRESVLEIGPGRGVLTQALIEAGATLTAIEIDDDLIPYLYEKFGEKISLLPFPMDPPFKLIANIPYHLTSHLLFTALQKDPKPDRLVLMLQKEVADRIVAKPPDMGFLSVACQLYMRCERICVVPRGAFQPVPKVDSAVIRMDRLVREGVDTERVLRFAKAGFSSPRKQLHRNIVAATLASSEDTKAVLISLGLDPLSRAETLTVEHWISLASLL